MAIIKIDGVDYDSEDLSKESLSFIASIQFIDNEATRLRNQMAILQTARHNYVESLKDSLTTSSKKKTKK